MKATVEWINLGMMDTNLTRSLGYWEERLKTPSRDSQHMTRKFEYPWIINNMDTKPYPWQANMLDAGSGSTALGFYMAHGITYGNSGHPVKMDMTHMDVDPEAVRWVEKNNGKATQGSVLAIPFADQSFDLVICVSVLEHLGYRDVGKAIRELLRVTRKKLLITMDVVIGVESQGFSPCKSQPNIHDLNILGEEFGFTVPDMPQDGFSFRLDGHVFSVACLKFDEIKFTGATG